MKSEASTIQVYHDVVPSENYDQTEGFIPRWRDAEEFIEDVTHNIWGKGNTELIRKTYLENCPVYSLSGKI